MSRQDGGIISVILSGFLLKNHHVWHQEFIDSKTLFGHNYVLFVDPGGVFWTLKHFWLILTHLTLCDQSQKTPGTADTL